MPYTGEMKDEAATTKKRPGTVLLIFGFVLVVLGGFLVIVGFATTHASLVPGTFRTVETQGAPTPAAWIILIVGLILGGIGFGKRVLAGVRDNP